MNWIRKHLIDQAERDRRAAACRVKRCAYVHRLQNHKLVLSGSRTPGQPRERSPYDLGIVDNAKLPLEDFYAIEDVLEALPPSVGSMG